MYIRHRSPSPQEKQWGFFDESSVSETGERSIDPRSGGGYRRIAHLKGHSSRILHVDWSTDGRCIQTCGQDYHLLYWEILPPETAAPQGRKTAATPGPSRNRRNSCQSSKNRESYNKRGTAGVDAAHCVPKSKHSHLFRYCLKGT